MALLIRTQYGLGHIWASGRLDGWLPTFALGYQEFLFYGPGQTVVIGLVRLLTLGALSDAGAYKVVALASLAIFPLAVVWLARGFGLSRRGAGLAAITSLLVSNPFGVGLHAVFQNSLVAEQLGAGLAFIVLGGIARLLAEPKRQWTWITGAALAALLITHIIATVILALLLAFTVPMFLLSDRLTWVSVRELLYAGMLGAGLAGFWLVPLVAHRNLRGGAATWGTPSVTSRLKDIWHGNYLFPPHVAPILAVTMLFAFYCVSRNRRWAELLIVLPVGYFVLCRWLLHRYPTNDLTIQLENRGLGMVAVVATFPLAELIASATARVKLPAVGNLLASGVAGLLVVGTVGPWRGVAAQMAPGTEAMSAAASELRRVVPVGARWVEVREYPDELVSTGVEHPDFWLAEESGRWTLNEFNPESSSDPGPTYTSEHLLDRPPDQAAADLTRLGVTDVVATTPLSTQQLSASGRLHSIWSQGGITILEVLPVPGQPPPSSLVSTAGPASARLISASGRQLRIDVASPSPTPATVAVAWSPKWHAEIDGRPARVQRSADGIVQLSLPAGSSQVRLFYSADVWDLVGLVVSLTVTAFAVAWFARRRLRNRRLRARALHNQAST